MKTLGKKLRKGATLLAAAGVYVPAVHCGNPQRANEGIDETAPQSTSDSSGTAAGDQEALAIERTSGGATDSGAASEPILVDVGLGVETAPASTLPLRPGAGSEAECRFLRQIGSASSPSESGSPPTWIVNETYARFSSVLGQQYQGQMHQEVDFRSGSPLIFSVGYTPSSEPWASRYTRIDVVFQFRSSGGSTPLFVRASSRAIGTLRAGGDSESIRPSQVCEFRTSAGKQQCAYPRWNPQGARYGLFDTITPDSETT